MNPFQYTGREWDQETGLYYYRARYYDPSAGRFLTEDPIGFQGGTNFYKYVANSFTNFRDPSGLCVDPGGSGTRYCVEAYIPQSTAWAGPFMFGGDYRGPVANDPQATFRFHQDYGSLGGHCKPGISTLFRKWGQPSSMSHCEISPTELPCGKKRIRFRAAAGDGWFFGTAPNAAYDITVTETDTGVVVTGAATSYPNIEVWQYSPDGTARLIYSGNTSWGPLGGPVSLLPPDPMVPIAPQNTMVPPK